MFSDKTLGLIHQAIDAEYESAKKKFGDHYASRHEGYGVLEEEVWECKKAYKAMRCNMKQLFYLIATNSKKDDISSQAMHILTNAQQLAMEACQVAAVCRKISESASNEK